MTFVVCECIVCVYAQFTGRRPQHPKIQSRNIHMSESFFSSLVLPVDGLGGGLVCLAESPHSHTCTCMYTYMVLGMCSRSILYIPSTTHIHVGRPNKCAPSEREVFLNRTTEWIF